MASEVRNYEVTIPAGTLASAPLLTDLAMPPRTVTAVRVRIPPGPRGLVGWALAVAGTQVIPWNAGAWIVGDDEILDWPLANQIDSGAWQLSAYNTGIYDHAIYVTFSLEPVGSRGGLALVAPLTITA